MEAVVGSDKCIREVKRGASIYVFDAKNGKMKVYHNLVAQVGPANTKIMMSNCSTRFLPREELEIKQSGAYFSLWVLGTNDDMKKVNEAFSKHVTNYAIEMTKKAQKEYNTKCKYYRTIIKNAEALNVQK